MIMKIYTEKITCDWETKQKYRNLKKQTKDYTRKNPVRRDVNEIDAFIDKYGLVNFVAYYGNEEIVEIEKE